MQFLKIKVFVFVSLSILSITGLSKEVSAIELTQTFISQLDLHVTTSCEDGSAIFKVTNVSDEKIKGVNFRLFKVTEGLVVSKRRMSLKKGQTATFKVKNANAISDKIGMFVDTSTLSRPEKVDVAIRCDQPL